MTIYIRDDGGIVGIKVDADGIDIVGGKAYFNIAGETSDRIVPIDEIVAIKEE